MERMSIRDKAAMVILTKLIYKEKICGDVRKYIRQVKGLAFGS